MAACVSDWANVQTAVQNDPSWAWACNDSVLRPIRAAINNMEGIRNSTTFWQTWALDQDFQKNVHKDFDATTVEENLSKVSDLKKAVEAVENELTMVKKMHLARKGCGGGRVAKAKAK
eukprot:55914-Alexandrium_andersonii.AAC.1